MQRREEITNNLSTRLEWFGERYDVINHLALGPHSERIYIGDRAKLVCRYCGLMPPQVKFRKLAHAIPDQIGNDWLFDREECDACNEHFAKWVEDDFGKWTLPWRALGRIKGKDGVPSIKSNDKQFRVEVAAKSAKAYLGAKGIHHDLKIYLAANDIRYELNEATKTVKLTLDRPSYVPMGVFKCLVKMAIAIMPMEDERKCIHLKRWILLPAHTFESYPYKPLLVMYQFVPGPLPNDRMSCWLLRRKPTRVNDCLYMQFVLELSNHIFQIALPMHVEDRRHLEAGTFQNCVWPSTWVGVDHQLKYGLSSYKEYDMSSAVMTRGETTSMTLRYDQLVDVHDTEATATSSERAD